MIISPPVKQMAPLGVKPGHKELAKSSSLTIVLENKSQKQVWQEDQRKVEHTSYNLDQFMLHRRQVYQIVHQNINRRWNRLLIFW